MVGDDGANGALKSDLGNIRCRSHCDCTKKSKLNVFAGQCLFYITIQENVSEEVE